MDCENYLCIYENNHKCVLDNISIDSLGMCSECIYVSPNSIELKKMKKNLLDKYDT